MLYLSALISGLLQLVSHLATKLYFPQLPLIPRYVIGTVCLLLPPTLVAGWEAAQPFWLSAAASGLAVLVAYWAGDRINEARDRKDELERVKLRETDLRKLIDGIRHAKVEEED